VQHTATHCNTLQHTATHCNTLQHIATHCNTLQHTVTHCSTHSNTRGLSNSDSLQHKCNTLQHTATHCNTLQHTAEYFSECMYIVLSTAPTPLRHRQIFWIYVCLHICISNYRICLYLSMQNTFWIYIYLNVNTSCSAHHALLSVINEFLNTCLHIWIPHTFWHIDLQYIYTFEYTSCST